MSETTEHPTLSEFLLERIAEDEYDAYDHYSQHEDGAGVAGAPCVHGDGVHPCAYRRRMLAECEAKRRIVEMAEVAHERGIVSASPLFLALRYLAVPYADHPDYREEWRP